MILYFSFLSFVPFPMALLFVFFGKILHEKASFWMGQAGEPGKAGVWAGITQFPEAAHRENSDGGEGRSTLWRPSICQQSQESPVS